MMNEELEWRTRKERVDKKLKALDPSWKIIKHHAGLDTTSLHCCAIEDYLPRFFDPPLTTDERKDSGFEGRILGVS